jgi:hypothetical protein
MQRWVMYVDTDAFDPAVEQRLGQLAGELPQTTHAARVAGDVVTLKVRCAGFETYTRKHRLPAPTPSTVGQ